MTVCEWEYMYVHRCTAVCMCVQCRKPVISGVVNKHAIFHQGVGATSIKIDGVDHPMVDQHFCKLMQVGSVEGDERRVQELHVQLHRSLPA